MYWKPSDVPHHDHKMREVRRYVENTKICRRYFLLDYFDPALAKSMTD